MKKVKKQADTSWEEHAEWYDKLLQGEGTYQKDLILPNLVRLMEIKRGERLLDLACGQGFFAAEFARQGAQVTGVDASKSLIDLARKNVPEAEFYVSSADDLSGVASKSIDKIAIILALQNLQKIDSVLVEARRVLKKEGSVHIVLNHPAFRIPKESSWGFDEREKIQYRRIDRYLSELKTEITMHPGKKDSDTTLSFHRPLQYYFKMFRKAGFAVMALEEWNSHKKSEPGPRSAAEDLARKEIPLFLYVMVR